MIGPALMVRDTSGSLLALEHDDRDGRTYLTVTFDGHEAPFELTPETAGPIAHALTSFAAPIDTSAIRFTGPSGELVKQGSPAVKQACGACGGKGREGWPPCGGCGR